MGWRSVPGKLKAEVVFAEKGSNHVTMVEDEKLRSILMKKFFQGDTLDNANAVVAKALKQKEEASKQFFF